MSLTQQEKQVLFGAIKALTGQKNDPFGTPTGPYLHGQYGLANIPGALPSIYSAVIQPAESFANDIPIKFPGEEVPDGYNIEAEYHTIITGQTAGALDSVANQPTTKCATPPKPGYLKLCTIANPYGKYWGGTETVDITDLGSIMNRAEPTTFNVRNDFYNGGRWLPSDPSGGVSNVMRIELAKRIRTSALAFQRMMGQQTYNGNPANTASSQNYKQILGLELQVNAGNKRDAFTSNICTAADSVVFDANYLSIDENPGAVHEYIREMWRQVNHNSSQMGLQPTTWKFLMRKQFFDKLTETWPVTQHLKALETIANFTNGRVVVNAGEATDLRNQMLQGKFIPIDGVLVPVMLDDFLDEENVTTNGNLLPGEFSSDVYLISYTVLGGDEVTYWNFKQQAHIDEQFAQQMGLVGVRAADGGKTLWMSMSRVGCFELAYVFAPRLVVRTPFLCARTQNLAYSPMQHYRDYNPASAYHKDGGRTTGISQGYYGEWGSTPLVLGNR